MVEQTWAWDNVDESKPLADPADHSQSLFTQGNMCLSASGWPETEWGMDSWEEMKMVQLSKFFL